MNAPTQGDRFRVQGRQDLFTVHTIEAQQGSGWIVRTQQGARWLLSSGDPLHKDVPFTGRPLPADPKAPER